MDKLGRWGDL